MATSKSVKAMRNRSKIQRKLGFPDKHSTALSFNRPLHDPELQATIVGVDWERFYLFLDIDVDGAQGELEFFLVTNDREGFPGAKFKTIEQSRGHYRVMLDITNDGHHRCVRPETYYVYALDANERWNEIMLSSAIGPAAASWTRMFPYAAAKQGYVVYFDLDKSSDKPVPLIRVQSTICHQADILGQGKHQPVGVVKEGSVKMQAKRDAISNYYRARRAQHLRDRDAKPTVVFASEQDDHLRSNLLAVHDRMIERGLDEFFDIRVACREATGLKRSKASWLETVGAYAEADFLFVDDYNPLFDWLHIDESTQIVQLWHAGAGFKAAGYARWGRTGAPKPYSAHRQYAYGISGSRKIRSFFSEVFGINEERILPLGMPRMDEYLDAGYRAKTTEELLSRFPMANGKKVILFAPTYRGLDKPRAMYPYDMIDFESLYELCGDEWVVFFKMHPWVSEPVPIPEEYRDRMVDVGSYPNINDLFYITELLITDYSSNIFEYSPMRKPMLFFAFDELEYSFVRGFHRPYEESAPGKVCRTFEEVIAAIQDRDFEEEKVEAYVEKHFDYFDSGASDRVIDWILLGKMPEDITDAIHAREAENARVDRLLFDRTPLLIARDGYAVDDDGFVIREWSPDAGAVSSDLRLADMQRAEREERQAKRAAARAAEKG